MNKNEILTQTPSNIKKVIELLLNKIEDLELTLDEIIKDIKLLEEIKKLNKN